MPSRMLEKLAALKQDTVLFGQGMLVLNEFSIANTTEIEELIQWLNPKFKLHTLSLRSCHLAEQNSIREDFPNIHSEEESISIQVTSSPQMSRHQRALMYTKSQALADLFNEYTAWETIDLSQNNLKERETDSLLKMLPKQTHLRRFDFSFNRLSDQGMDSLAECLRSKDKTLKYLNLERTNISHKQLEILINSLLENTTLRELNLKGNAIIDVGLFKLMTLLEKNHNIVKIELDVENHNAELVSQLKARLTYNQEQQRKFHRQLLAKDRLESQAALAIATDDAVWLQVLLGLETSVEQEALDYARDKFAAFSKLRHFQFRCEVLQEVIHFLKTLTPLLDAPKSVTAQKDLNALLEKSQHLELSVMREYLDLAEVSYVEGQLVPLTEERKRILLKEHQHQLILPTLEALKLQLPPGTEVGTLTRHYEDAFSQAWLETEKAKKEYDEILNAHSHFQTRYLKLRNNVRKLTMNAEMALEREELEEKLLQTRLDPNLCDANGETLLMDAFNKGSIHCLKILLKQGADPFKTNHAHTSVFKWLVNRPEKDKSACQKAVIEYIQKSIDRVWLAIESEFVGHEDRRLQKLKSGLDTYLDTLLENNRKSKAVQIFSGISLCLDDRKEDLENYYLLIKEGGQHYSPEDMDVHRPLKDVLNVMFQKAVSAKRGILRRSKLHENVKKESQDFIHFLEKNEREYARRLRALREAEKAVKEERAKQEAQQRHAQLEQEIKEAQEEGRQANDRAERAEDRAKQAEDKAERAEDKAERAEDRAKRSEEESKAAREECRQAKESARRSEEINQQVIQENREIKNQLAFLLKYVQETEQKKQRSEQNTEASTKTEAKSSLQTYSTDSELKQEALTSEKAKYKAALIIQSFWRRHRAEKEALKLLGNQNFLLAQGIHQRRENRAKKLVSLPWTSSEVKLNTKKM